MMIISSHGGLCCGIQHIHSIGSSPDETYCGALSERDDDVLGDQVDSTPMDQLVNLFYKAAPKETFADRFRRYVKFLSQKRKNSLTQVAIIGGNDWYSQGAWVPVLTEQGFKKVSSFRNGNTGRTIDVYHLILVNGKPA